MLGKPPGEKLSGTQEMWPLKTDRRSGNRPKN
jgi:hypothetical protein